ncbi:MAG: carotenoid biosynthesis protein [Chloroflexi bacterium]|nr:MAG: carotenoid biosynthesis protein [Chloroflexota bacterium]
MVSPAFVTFEILVYILFLFALVHAWRRGIAIVWQLLAGVLFGLLLEWATIQQLQAYEYGEFLVMFSEVPLSIGVAWGTIIYTASLFSDSTNLPEWIRPILDALLALSIDLSMDAIAIRLGFWQWGIPVDEEFFGVPYANFWAWFWVVFSFSAGLRMFIHWKHPLADWAAPPAAIVSGVLGVLLTNRLIVYTTEIYPLYLSVIAAVILGAVILVLLQRPRFVEPPHRLSAWVPTAFHAYYLIAGWASGIFSQTPILLLISLVMAAVALRIHWMNPGRERKLEVL